MQRGLPPKYGLYGESVQPLDPGYVHIEDIASRSRQLGWKIPSHRHANLFQVLHLAEGEMTIDLEGNIRQLTAPCTVTLPVGVIHGFEFHPNTSGKVLSIATDLMGSTPFATQFDQLSSEVQLLEWPAVSDLHKRFTLELNALQEELDESQPGFESAMEWQAGRILILLRRALTSYSRISGEAPLSGSQAAERFTRLVEDNYTKHLPLADYSNRLHLSLSSLHRHCIARFGIAPKQIIENRLIREAKRRLVYTQNHAEQIAYQLGFKDAAYFTRFFKRNVGLTPGQYRKETSRRK